MNKNKFILLYISIILTYSLSAQTRINFSVSQFSGNDWKKGQIQSLAVLSQVDTRQELKIDTLSFFLRVKYEAGYVYEKNEGKNEEYFYPSNNKLFGEGILIYPVGWKTDPYISVSMDTQILHSYRYIKGKRVTTAFFWDPVTSVESIGFSYYIKNKNDYLLTLLGLTYKQIRTDKNFALTDIRKTKDIIERYKEESGIQFKSDCNIKLDSLTAYKACFELFNNFLDINVWTLKLENEIQFNFWKFFIALIKLDFYYDANQIDFLQYQQNFCFGFTASF